jgi:hypothetical protein
MNCTIVQLYNIKLKVSEKDDATQSTFQTVSSQFPDCSSCFTVICTYLKFRHGI